MTVGQILQTGAIFHMGHRNSTGNIGSNQRTSDYYCLTQNLRNRIAVTFHTINLNLVECESVSSFIVYGSHRHRIFVLKPGFHIVVSVVRKKFIGQMQIYGNLPYRCSIQKKRQIQLFVRDRMNSICPTTDTTIWKPGFRTP